MEEVVTEIGKFKLRKPKAGLRNKALIEATINGEMNQYQFLVNLLPKCVVEHPFGINNKLKDELDNMEIVDYDLLIQTMSKMIQPKDIEKEAKKLETPSSSEHQTSE